MPDLFPAVPPVVNGQLITIEQWLQQPARVQRIITDLSLERFVVDEIYAQGPTATGGAVIYDQVMGTELYPATRDVQAIQPGALFPLVDVGEVAPLVANTVKWGGSAFLTYEERDRDKRDVLRRKLVRITNAIVRKVDTVGLAVLRAAPILQVTSSGNWAGTIANVFADVAAGKTAVDRTDMGYTITKAIISPNTALSMLTNAKLLNTLPREAMGANISPIIEGRLSGLAGIQRWIVTNRCGDDEVFLLDGQMAGSISDEKPLYSRVVDQPETERVLIMAGRLTVPYVTDPKSVTRIVGVGTGS